MDNFYLFVSRSFNIPRELQNTISGKIAVSFVVEKNGKISDCKVRQSLHPLLDKEAVRVLKSYPAWKPGIMKGQKVRVYYTLPITIANN